MVFETKRLEKLLRRDKIIKQKRIKLSALLTQGWIEEVGNRLSRIPRIFWVGLKSTLDTTGGCYEKQQF